MANIYIRYKINNAQPKYSPGMNISGRVWVESGEDKDKKLKKVQATVMEFYEVYETRKSGKVRTTSWWNENKKVLKHKIASKDTLPAGATKEYDFSFDLPDWKPRIGDRYRNWWLGVFFVQKTGLIANPGARPIDAVFILPVEGTTAPLSVIQGIIGGASRSVVEGSGSVNVPGVTSGPTMDTGYAQSLAQQATSQIQKGVGGDPFQRLESYLPKNDEIIFKTIARVGIEITGQSSRHWNSPVLVSRHGIGFIRPSKEKGGYWDFSFKPWINVKKLKKGVKFGSQLDQVSGEIFFKLKRGIFGRIFMKLMRSGNESRSDFKQRKKEFRDVVPDLYKSAKKIELWADEIEETFDNPTGAGTPIGSTADPFASSSSTSSFEFAEESSSPTDFGTSSPTPTEESFDEKWDDDWFEEPAPAPTTNPPVTPQTDFIPDQSTSTESLEDEDWDWDDWED